MKIFQFIRWQWRQWEWWQKTFIVSAFLFGVSANLSEPYKTWVWGISMANIVFWLMKWVLWDGTKSAYRKFVEEQNSLFTTIKESDK